MSARAVPNAEPTAEIVARAAHWAALLGDADVTRQVHEACERWCGQDPRHRVALDRMRGLAARFDRLDGVERETLTVAAARRARPGRRSAIAALALDRALVAASQHLPGFTARFLDMPNQADDSITIVGSAPIDRGEAVSVQLFADPRDGSLLGWRETEVLSFDRRHLMDMLYALHNRKQL